jgi:hypothetical protein
VRNLLVSAAVLAILTGPLLYASRHMLYGYYGIGHVLGPERAIRVAAAGIKSIYDHLLFYPESLRTYHLDSYFFILAAATIFLAAVQRREPQRALSASPVFDIAFLCLAIVGTFAILTANAAKSVAVAGIVLAPCVLLVVAFAALVSRTRQEAPAWLVGSAVTCAMLIFAVNASAAQRPLTVQELKTVSRLNAAAADYIEVNNLTAPRIGLDRVQDFLNSGTVWIEYQERDLRRRGIRPGNSLGSIFAIEQDRAIAALASSDIAFLSDNSDRPGVYPFHESMRDHWPAMQDYARKNMTLLAEGRVLGITYYVYVRKRS